MAMAMHLVIISTQSLGTPISRHQTLQRKTTILQTIHTPITVVHDTTKQVQTVDVATIVQVAEVQEAMGTTQDTTEATETDMAMATDSSQHIQAQLLDTTQVHRQVTHHSR